MARSRSPWVQKGEVDYTGVKIDAKGAAADKKRAIQARQLKDKQQWQAAHPTPGKQSSSQSTQSQANSQFDQVNAAQQAGTLDATGNFAGTGRVPNDLNAGWTNAHIVLDPPRKGRPATAWAPNLGYYQETSTVGNELAKFDSGMAPEQVSELQRQLWQGGFYGAYNPASGKLPFITGQKDAKTRAAYIQALEEAAQQGVGFGTFLTQRAAANAAQGGAGTGGTNVVQHAAAEDVAVGALAGWQKALGRGPTPQELEAFRAGYAARETSAQPDTSGGGTFTVNDPGTISNVAFGQAQQQNQQEAQGYSQVEAFGMMLKAMGVAQ